MLNKYISTVNINLLLAFLYYIFCISFRISIALTSNLVYIIVMFISSQLWTRGLLRLLALFVSLSSLGRCDTIDYEPQLGFVRSDSPSPAITTGIRPFPRHLHVDFASNEQNNREMFFMMNNLPLDPTWDNVTLVTLEDCTPSDMYLFDRDLDLYCNLRGINVSYPISYYSFGSGIGCVKIIIRLHFTNFFLSCTILFLKVCLFRLLGHLTFSKISKYQII